MKAAPDFKAIHKKLLAWYTADKRILPWRKNQDPYRIWISEIMLQQTRVEAVIPYYERFLQKFPTVKSLAASTEEEVTALWAGLGYYSRARNLRLAAQQLQENFSGEWPKDVDQLRSLRGIGPYTAAAIASMAFNLPHAAIDGNLERVIARLLALKENPKKAGYADIEKFAQALIAHGSAGDINQAFMDLSSQLCLPKTPRCTECPLQSHCLAFAKKLTAEIPLKEKKAAPISLQSNGLIIFHKNYLLITKRSTGQWLTGLWDIPWWTAREKDPQPHLPSLRLPKEFGQAAIQRGITKYSLDFAIRFYRLKERPSDVCIKKALGTIAAEWRWLKIAPNSLIPDILPRPTQKALQVALRELD